VLGAGCGFCVNKGEEVDDDDTTGKPSFAVRENLCRAFSIGRTAKNFFAVRFI
jgi:hypothetical protein